MNKKILIGVGVLIVVVLIIFFYPKTCGSRSSWGPITGIKCECIGVAYTPPHYYDGGPNLCYGICLKNTCTQLPQEKELSFETIEKGEYSTHTKKENFVINDNKTYYDLWRKLYPSCLNVTTDRGISTVCDGVSIIPKIDFSKETVIAVFMGEKNTGGYSIEITKIIDKTDKVIVYVNETTPKPGDLVTLALTQPYHIVKTKKILGPVEFQKIE